MYVVSKKMIMMKYSFVFQNANPLPPALFSTYANTYFDKNQAMFFIAI